jgi:hypothetical protein
MAPIHFWRILSCLYGRVLYAVERKFGRMPVFVAQTSSLPYRRLLVGNLAVLATPADWKSAIRQVGNLRYEMGFFFAHLTFGRKEAQ